MKKTFFVYLLTLNLISCQSSKIDEIEKSVQVSDSTDHINETEWQQELDTVLLGDMNNDNIQDTAFITSPIFKYPDLNDYSSGGCKDDSCATTIRFSFNTAILIHNSALGFLDFFKLEDLDSDGVNEIGFVPNWFQSCQQGLFIYSLKSNRWNQIASGSVYVCKDQDFSGNAKKIDKNKFQLKSLIWSEEQSDLIDSTILITL